MTRTFTREEILGTLRESIARRRPILCATAGNGLVARSLEAGGLDLLLTSITGLARQKGLTSLSLPLEDNNAYVLGEVVDELGDVVQATPVIASIGACLEPVDVDLDALVRRVVARGYAGILNFPTVGEVDSRRFDQSMEEYIARGTGPGATMFDRQMGVAAAEHRTLLRRLAAERGGFSREVELIAAASRQGVFTMAYAFTTQAAAAVVAAGADVLVGHCGGTGGGSAGRSLIGHEQAASILNEIFDAARAVRDDVIILGHGGPFATAADTARLYELTSAHGFLSGSAIERIPVEVAVSEAVHEFRDVEVTRGGAGREVRSS